MLEKTSAGQLEAINAFLRHNSQYGSKSVEQIRQDMRSAAQRLPDHEEVAIHQIAIGDCNGEWVIPHNLAPDNEDRAIIYYHGGGFIAGSCEVYRDLCARLAIESGVKVLCVEYRLAPEYPYPTANEDCINVYRWLLANGYHANRLVIGGDSVGGSLALMTLLSLRDQGEALPAGAFLLSPHTDLVHLDGESYQSRATLDPTGSLEGNKRIIEAYVNGNAEEIPLLSPLRMNLAGLPELFIQVGDHEVLLSDSIRFTEAARTAGVEVALEVWDEMWTGFQLLAYMLPEAQQAITHIAEFIRKKLC